MKLLRLRISNAFSYKEAELDLNDRGLVLVTGYSHDDGGSNGSGKSSLINKAICWGLFGKTPHGYKSDQIVNRHVKPSGKRKTVKAEVSVDFIGVDGNKYTVTRSRNPNKTLLSASGRDISDRIGVDTQNEINRLLGRDFRLFVQSDFFGQGRKQSFISLPVSEQKAMLEEILALYRVEELVQSTVNSTTKLNNKLQEKQNQLDLLKREQVTLEATKKDLEESSERWKQRRL